MVFLLYEFLYVVYIDCCMKKLFHRNDKYKLLCLCVVSCLLHMTSLQPVGVSWYVLLSLLILITSTRTDHNSERNSRCSWRNLQVKYSMKLFMSPELHRYCNPDSKLKSAHLQAPHTHTLATGSSSVDCTGMLIMLLLNLDHRM